jgi:signal transduction histidine kinase
LLEVADSEQVKLGQDLHDGLCQQLAAMSFSANLLREMIGETDRGLVSQAERLSLDVDNAITQARDLAKGLYPARLEREGLAPALLELAANIESRFAIRCETRLDPVPAWIPPAAMIHLYRIAQEAIVNAAKHSGGSRIHVALGSDHSGAVSLQVKDDGKGMDSHRSSDGMGLSIMEHRTRLIGAELVIRSEPGKGLSVNCRLPYDSLSSRT